MSKISHIHAREILDSRGKPTVEAEVHLEGGVVGIASVPSGASTGAAEARELRDGDEDRYDGQGVRRAVENVNLILGPALLGKFAGDQQGIDASQLDLDGSANKQNLGANAILSVSLAVSRAAANSKGIPLYRHIHDSLLARAESSAGDFAFAPVIPLPMTNMISGGKHAGGNLDIQDVLVIPKGASSYPVGLEWIVRVYRRLGELLCQDGYEGYLVGDEGGYGPRLKSNAQAMECVVRAIEKAGLRPGEDVSLALDVASSHFYRDGHYVLKAEQGRRLSSAEMVERLAEWAAAFPIDCMEDGLAEEDWQGWQRLTKKLGSKIKLVGDDLFATNASRLRKGIELQAANAVLIKVNQIGTLSETFDTILTAKKHGYATIISARSGETEDDFLSDLAVGVGGDYIKIGSIARSERLAKYNRLLRIWEELTRQT
ncbi:MAG: phosphopyruvate hydratase [Pirellulaceae bacterium]|nr:phosphopyruvate hydratase [Pirellulaceae bacterium]